MIERDEKKNTILGGRVDSFLYEIVEWADISFEVNEKTRIMIESGKTKLISRLMEGQYPRYNQLIPTTFPK